MSPVGVCKTRRDELTGELRLALKRTPTQEKKSHISMLSTKKNVWFCERASPRVFQVLFLARETHIGFRIEDGAAQ